MIGAQYLFWIKLGLVAAAVSAAALAIGHRINTIKAESYQAGFDAATVKADAAEIERHARELAQQKAQAAADLAALHESATENQRLQARRQAGATGATNVTIEQLRGAAAAGLAARDEREQLRDQVAELERLIAAAADAEPPCRTDAAGAAGLRLLDECAGRYQTLAGDAGELAARITGLQRWVSGVCTEPVEPGREGGRLDE
jgi:hypothetical protein